MKFEEYYGLLKVSDKDRLLIAGGEPLLLGMYIAGRAKKEGLTVSVHALVAQKSKVRSEMDAVKYAKTKLKKDAGIIEDGAPLVTFSAEYILNYKTKSVFSKSMVEIDEFESALPILSKINQMTARGGLVLLNLPLLFFRKINVTTKHLFGEKKEAMSFRQFLDKMGCKITFYDAVESRMFCLFNMEKFSPPAKIAPLSFDEFGDLIMKEILDYVIYLRTDVQVSIESDDREYLYFVGGEKTHDQPIQCSFIFLDGRGSWTEKEPSMESRTFSIIVLPNTDGFKKELEDKEILIMNKERAFEVYGEEVEPY